MKHDSDSSNLGSEKKLTQSLVPLVFLYGLAGLDAFLSLLIVILTPSQLSVWLLGLIYLAIYMVLVPLGFVVGAAIWNKWGGEQIARRNALTLGYLTATIGLLWQMGNSS